MCVARLGHIGDLVDFTLWRRRCSCSQQAFRPVDCLGPPLEHCSFYYLPRERRKTALALGKRLAVKLYEHGLAIPHDNDDSLRRLRHRVRRHHPGQEFPRFSLSRLWEGRGFWFGRLGKEGSRPKREINPQIGPGSLIVQTSQAWSRLPPPVANRDG